MSDKIILGKKNAAPRNRSIFLTTEDLKTYKKLPEISKKNILKKELPKHVDKLYYADTFEALKKLPKNSVDLLFADPPYNIGKQFGKTRIKMTPEKFRAWNEEWLKLVKPLLKKNASLYVCCDWRYSYIFHDLLEEMFTVRNRITWQRDKGRGAKTNWKNNHEDIWFATVSNDYKFNLEDVKVRKKVIAPYREKGVPKDWKEEKNGEKIRMTHPSNIWTDLCVPFWSMPENTPHPTQKPESLVERVLLSGTHENDLVLDPFAGSGTTAVVAKKLKRKFICFENNPDYVRLALKRLDLALCPG